MSDEPNEVTTEAPTLYGPFFRRASPTQTLADALEQFRSGQIWGRAPQGSGVPQVQAYRGRLPDGVEGIEFYTPIRPNPGGRPKEARWSGPPHRHDIPVVDDFAIIECVVVVVFYR